MRKLFTTVFVLSISTTGLSAMAQERSITAACRAAITNLVEAQKMLVPGLRSGSVDEHAVVGAIDRANLDINNYCSIEGQSETKGASGPWPPR